MAGNRTGVAGRKSDPDRGGVVPFKSELSALKEFLSAVLSAASENILIRDCSNYEGLEKGYYRIAVKQRTDNEKLLKALEYIYEGGE